MWLREFNNLHMVLDFREFEFEIEHSDSCITPSSSMHFDATPIDTCWSYK